MFFHRPAVLKRPGGESAEGGGLPFRYLGNAQRNGAGE
jgi:hypothetical protein